jgi:hypothetical protein
MQQLSSTAVQSGMRSGCCRAGALCGLCVQCQRRHWRVGHRGRRFCLSGSHMAAWWAAWLTAYHLSIHIINYVCLLCPPLVQAG